MKENWKRRTFIKRASLASLGVTVMPEILRASRIENFSQQSLLNDAYPYTLPMMPYAYNDLEPYIDAETMGIHHTKHHQAYVDKLNKGLEEHKLTETPLSDLFKKMSAYPTVIRNNGGGHYNHTFFWSLMTHERGMTPAGRLLDAIIKKYETLEKFKFAFSEMAKSRFGSGWTWLVVNESKQLEICSTPNQDNPFMDDAAVKGIPILALDVWEHAYYLKYQNRRLDYIDAWWNVVNWNKVEEYYNSAR